MKFIFIDKTDKECDIITDVLSSYNVLYRINTKRERQMFSAYVSYDIEIDVEPAFYEYLCKEIQPKLDTLNLLEDCYELPAYQKAEDIVNEIFSKPSKSLKKSVKSELSDVLGSVLPDLFEHLHGITNPEEYGNTLIKFDDLPDELKDNLLSRFPRSLLDSKNCRIRKTSFGISIEFTGEDDE